MVLGQDAKNIKELTAAVNKVVKGKEIKLTVVEVKNPSLDAVIVAKKMAKDLEERASTKKVLFHYIHYVKMLTMQLLKQAQLMVN